MTERVGDGTFDVRRRIALAVLIGLVVGAVQFAVAVVGSHAVRRTRDRHPDTFDALGTAAGWLITVAAVSVVLLFVVAYALRLRRWAEAGLALIGADVIALGVLVGVASELGARGRWELGLFVVATGLAVPLVTVRWDRRPRAASAPRDRP